MQKQPTIKIAVSGAHETDYTGSEVLDLAKALGKEVAQHHALLVTGATTGFPLWASMGAHEAGGTVIGFSPAASTHEHKHVYRLPDDHVDMLVCTGFGYGGANLLMVRSSDAVLFGYGKIGTINEFTIACDEKKVIGILEGDWKIDEILTKIVKDTNKKDLEIIFDSDPRRLVEQVIKKVKERYQNNKTTA